MNPNEKPTLDLDQLAIIRGLLERAETKMDTVGSKVDLLDSRFKNLEATTDGLRHEVHRLAGRVTGTEEDIRELREKDATILRETSSHDREHEAAIGGAIVHARRLDETVQAMAKVQEAMAEELGMDHRAIVTEGRSLPPGVKPKRTTLKKIATENKGGALMAAVTLGLMIAQIVAKVLGVHFVLP